MKIMEKIAVAVALSIGSCAAQASTIYTNEASFLAAAGNALSFESFETVRSSTSTQYNFADVSFACTGTQFCPSFFGTSGVLAHDGAQSVFFASPDTATFTFTQAISAFGIWIGGAGDVASLTLTAALGNGDTAPVLTNYSTPNTTTWNYFGIVADTAFTSITFTPTNIGDGIYFDALRYQAAAVNDVPEPASALLFGIAGAGLLALRRKRGARR